MGARASSAYYLTKEIEKTVSRRGIEIKEPNEAWYDVSDQGEGDYFAEVAAGQGWDPELANAVWQRHHRQAFQILELAEQTPTLALPVVPGFNYLWAEVAAIRETELVACLDDFLYRRTELGRLLGESLFASVSRQKLESALRLGASATTAA